MKTVIAILIAMGGGAGVAAVGVASVSSVVGPDKGAIEQSDQTTIDVLVYGDRS